MSGHVGNMKQKEFNNVQNSSLRILMENMGIKVNSHMSLICLEMKTDICKDVTHS